MLGPHCPDPATLALEVLQFRAAADRVGLPLPGMDLAIGRPVATFQLNGAITCTFHLKGVAEFIELLLAAGKTPVTMIAKSEVLDVIQGFLAAGEGLCALYLPHQAIVLLADAVAQVNLHLKPIACRVLLKGKYYW